MALTPAPDEQQLLEHGLFEQKFENSLLHSDVRFRNDNGTLFGYLEEATYGTTFASSVNTYERTSNGRAEWLDLSMQHAGDSKWKEQLKTPSYYVSGTKWDGNTNITLDRHIRNFQLPK